ncbi:MAG TPA: flagellar motor protein MotB, partial [Burkholderiaceae bacterium]|nr:flagellar motor protein MotB [Burkholderiaceae bacterium]
MAGDAKKLQPIIVKRVKKAAHGHHGGAWKIAYADFVTAMMAFFLLMWLLGSTTDGDKKGIADYFNSPLRVSLMGGGSGSGDSSHVIKGGGTDLTRSHGQVKRGDVKAKRDTINLQALKHQVTAAEWARLNELRGKLLQTMTESDALAPYRSQMQTDMTGDGLRIQIVDSDSRPMFTSGSAVVQPYMRDLLHAIGSVLTDVPNKLTLEGHTDATPFPGGDRGYSNWELSADRANASRRELVAGGLSDQKILRVQGLAASIPYERDNPHSPLNRRISIIVMNREAEDRMYAAMDPAASASAPAPGGDDK